MWVFDGECDVRQDELIAIANEEIAAIGKKMDKLTLFSPRRSRSKRSPRCLRGPRRSQTLTINVSTSGYHNSMLAMAKTSVVDSSL